MGVYDDERSATPPIPSAAPMGRELALELHPSYDADHVRHLQRLTTDARRLLEDADIDLATAQDVRATVQRAAMGGTLTGLELLAVQETLRGARVARQA